MPLFDTHCHLQDERLLAGVDAVMARAAAAGVDRVNCCGATPSDWSDVAALAARFPGRVIPCFGLHPLYVREATPGWMADLEKRLVADPAAAVGEIGLDRSDPKRDDRRQQDAFLAQLEFACRLNRPVSLHCRGAWGILPDILRELGKPLPPIVIHSYSGSVELLRPMVELGCFFSFSGAITRGGNRRGTAAAAAAPADRLLAETDAPDLMPALERDKPVPRDAVNEPANLVHVIRKLAELRGTTPENAARLTWQNACAAFRMDPA